MRRQTTSRRPRGKPPSSRRSTHDARGALRPRSPRHRPGSPRTNLGPNRLPADNQEVVDLFEGVMCAAGAWARGMFIFGADASRSGWGNSGIRRSSRSRRSLRARCSSWTKSTSSASRPVQAPPLGAPGAGDAAIRSTSSSKRTPTSRSHARNARTKQRTIANRAQEGRCVRWQTGNSPASSPLL